MSYSLMIQPPFIESSVEVGENLFGNEVDFCQTFADKLFYITTVSLEQALPSLSSLLTLPSGEVLKQRAFKEEVEDYLFQKGCSRTSCLIGIGGGALLDMVGFVASTYCRGISYVLFPTTLLAMTDAAIGGKTGVNLSYAKNFVGTFHFPKKVYVDLCWLETLPEREYINGIAETIKHGLIGDERLFIFLEKNCEGILKREKNLLKEMISSSIQVKIAIVQNDPFECSGLRSLLNFGHTVGHALEAKSKYTLAHGEAIAMGMLVEGAMAMEMGFFERHDFERMAELILRVPFNLSFPDDLPFEWMKKDKKGECVFVPLKKIGKPAIVSGYVVSFTEKLFEKAWGETVSLLEKREPCRCL